MIEWLKEYATVFEVLGVVSAVSFVASLIAIPVLVARIPDDYFVRDHSSPSTFRNRHPVLKLLVTIGKNILGVLTLLIGVVMLFLPGQGVLMMLVGLFLIDFPAKRRLELALIRRPNVLQSVNWLRRKSGRSDLRVY